MRSNIVARMLGEQVEPEVAMGTPAPASDIEQGAVTSPSVEALEAAWKAGNKHAVALRVLDALDSYEQFVQLLFQIGQADAIQLGHIMDELTSDEKSPHKYDQMSDEMALKQKNPSVSADSPVAMGSTQ
jgi:hypothetical protein